MFDLLSTLDADAAAGVASRRRALHTVGKIGLGAAAASIPFLKPSVAFAQSGGNTAFEVLNYALTLEYLERSFYRQALDMNYLSTARPLVETIEADETAHVALLRGAIEAAGGDPVDYEDADFTFGDFLSSYDNFLALAQSLEDTGVRAYKGQAGAIQGTDYLTTALQIHSVEGRHAAAIRRLRGNQGWIPLDQPGAPVPAVYGAGNGFPAEDNVTQGGVDLAGALTGYTRQEITEAFDEGLDMETVLGIAGGFITGNKDQDDDGDGSDNN
ncbi:ferritin-like domain-containing protein [Rubrivirga sp. S365]|uniref:Ferritin-like domain-containing protein n=1 Tax=Rubrivirga litoralis TaxID=3075598 RepID=A0ABU3BR91_9BACT|nr:MULTISPECIES: ferritin-like domain-containing protein [unclassified Rubrivirga]MDT0631701.1 ferritin-like domain-containing protein [Rubrivirga sp. F394]MDT7855555.1 ferritin-like domain-containing protein [Rubrivirga sp. S365]